MDNKIILVMVLILPLTSWSKNINEVPLAEHLIAKKIVDNVYHEIISTWSVDVGGENSNVIYLNSPIRKINKSQSYCAQNFIKIYKDEFDKPSSVKSLLFGSELYEEYSLNSNDLPCNKVLRNSMFRVLSLNESGVNVGLLTMLKEISEKPWLNKGNKKYRMIFDNDEARVCLSEGNVKLNILNVREIPSDGDYLNYEVNTQGCVVDNKKWIVRISVREFIDGTKYELHSRAIQDDVIECFRKECYKAR